MVKSNCVKWTPTKPLLEYQMHAEKLQKKVDLSELHQLQSRIVYDSFVTDIDWISEIVTRAPGNNIEMLSL